MFFSGFVLYLFFLHFMLQFFYVKFVGKCDVECSFRIVVKKMGSHICGGEGQTFCDAIFHLPANNKFPDLHVHTN